MIIVSYYTVVIIYNEQVLYKKADNIFRLFQLSRD